MQLLLQVTGWRVGLESTLIDRAGQWGKSSLAHQKSLRQERAPSREQDLFVRLDAIGQAILAQVMAIFGSRRPLLLRGPSGSGGCFKIDTTFGHATSWLDFRPGSLASFMKKGKGKGQVQGAGGNSVGKGGGKAKSQTEVPSRRGVAERPSCHGQHRRPRGSVFAGGIEKDEAGSVPWPGLGTSRSMCAVYLSSREASPQGRRSAGKVAGRSYKFGPRARRGRGLVWRRCVPKLLRKWLHLHNLLAIPLGQRKYEDSNSWSRIFAAKSVLSRREKTDQWRGVEELWAAIPGPSTQPVFPTIQPLSKKFDLIEQGRRQTKTGVGHCRRSRMVRQAILDFIH